MDSKAETGWAVQWFCTVKGCRWGFGQSSYCDDHQDLYTLIQCFSHGNVKPNQTSTRTRCERTEEKTLLPNTIICQAGFLSAAVDRTLAGNVLHRLDVTHTHRNKTDAQEGTAGNRWNSHGGGSVFSVLVCVSVCGPGRHRYPVIFQGSLGWGAPQGQQGLSMTSVTSMPYTSRRSTRKERSPWGSSPMALTWSAVRVGSVLPTTSERVWKMRLFSSMKNLRQN